MVVQGKVLPEQNSEEVRTAVDGDENGNKAQHSSHFSSSATTSSSKLGWDDDGRSQPSIGTLESRLKEATESISEIMLALRDAEEARDHEVGQNQRIDDTEERAQEPVTSVNTHQQKNQNEGEFDLFDDDSNEDSEYDGEVEEENTNQPDAKVVSSIERSQLQGEAEKRNNGYIAKDLVDSSDILRAEMEQSAVQVSARLIVDAQITRNNSKDHLGIKVVRHRGKEGIYISHIDETSPLACAEIQSGMRITQIDGIACPETIPEMMEMIQETSNPLTIQVVSNSPELTHQRDPPVDGEKVYQYLYGKFLSIISTCGDSITNAADNMLFVCLDFYRSTDVENFLEERPSTP